MLDLRQLRDSGASLLSELESCGRFVYRVLREIKRNGLDYRAMSLVYTTLLALIPLLAVSFSVFKAFGAETSLEPLLLEWLEPFGDKADVIAARIVESVKKLKVGVFGMVGFLFLFFTSVSLLEKVEESFNHIWRVRASRSLLRRFSDYLSFILVGPLLLFAVFGGMTNWAEKPPDMPFVKGVLGAIFETIHDLLPFVFVITAFTFVYRLIPNARVKNSAALFGGVIAGLAWKTAGWGFALFVAGSARYHAVYSGFAILVLFMIWLYLSWLILLLGVQISFFYQHPSFLRFGQGPVRLSARGVERVGLMLMWLIGRQFFLGNKPWRVEDLGERLELPENCIAEILQVLQQRGVVMTLDGEKQTYVPARDLASISMQQVVDGLRSAYEQDFPLAWGRLAVAEVDTLAGSIEQAIEEKVTGVSLRDLVSGSVERNSEG